ADRGRRPLPERQPEQKMEGAHGLMTGPAAASPAGEAPWAGETAASGRAEPHGVRSSATLVSQLVGAGTTRQSELANSPPQPDVRSEERRVGKDSTGLGERRDNPRSGDTVRGPDGTSSAS